MPLLAGTGGDTGQERSTGGVSVEFSSGEQGPLILEVKPSPVSIPKLDASAGSGRLQGVAHQGCALQHQLLPLPPAAGELVRGKALGLRDLRPKISLNEDEFCAVRVCAFPFSCKQGPCLPQELEAWNMHVPALPFSLFLC